MDPSVHPFVCPSISLSWRTKPLVTFGIGHRLLNQILSYVMHIGTSLFELLAVYAFLVSVTRVERCRVLYMF